jgi:hypothetical protein
LALHHKGTINEPYGLCMSRRRRYRRYGAHQHNQTQAQIFDRARPSMHPLAPNPLPCDIDNYSTTSIQANSNMLPKILKLYFHFIGSEGNYIFQGRRV